MAVPLKVPLLTIVVVGRIVEIQPIRLLDRVNIHRSYIGSRQSGRGRLLFTVLVAIAAIKGIPPIVFLLLLLYI